jgi:hypothetical protein
MKGHKLLMIYIETRIMDGKHLNEDGYISKDQNDHVPKDGQNQQDDK